jgi:hypothetical protein
VHYGGKKYWISTWFKAVLGLHCKLDKFGRIRFYFIKSAPRPHLKLDLLSAEFDGLDLEVDADRRDESRVERVVGEPGTDFFKYFHQKIQRKKLAFFTQNKAEICKILIITLVFEKNAIFSQKIGENRRKL